MRLGIDLGTTRTLVAVSDRGNFPLIGFSSRSGDFSDHYPTTSAEVDGELVHGLDAEDAARDGAPVLRSWKRLFSELRVHEGVRIGRVETTLQELATSFLRSLRRDLLQRSNLPRARRGDSLEVAVSVPANAHSAQRFATLEAFHAAGFDVRAILNEPSAAGIEYAHRHRETITGKREHVAIYDLGGGTFDAALVLMSRERHEVVATNGIARLGGDDFDSMLLDMALERAGLTGVLSDDTHQALLLEARAAKETITPNTRRVLLDLAALGQRAPAEPVIVDVAAYYDRVTPLVERTLDALEPVLANDESSLAGVCVVGGASALPLVPRLLRERFGRRMHRSPHPAGSVAIGLAIAGTEDEAPELHEVLTRHLGVFRERDSGTEISFDGILPKGSALPRGAEKLSVIRRYRAAHNIGHYRFVECSSLDGAGGPAGDITPHAQVLFPFASALAESELSGEPVERLDSDGPLVEERYAIDAAGVVEVTISNLDGGYERRYVL